MELWITLQSMCFYLQTTNTVFRFLVQMVKIYIPVIVRAMASTHLRLIQMECTSTVSTTECQQWLQRSLCSAWMLVNNRKMESPRMEVVLVPLQLLCYNFVYQSLSHFYVMWKCLSTWLYFTPMLFSLWMCWKNFSLISFIGTPRTMLNHNVFGMYKTLTNFIMFLSLLWHCFCVTQRAF